MNIRLGVNIDHVATVRNARGGTHPEPLRLAKEAQAGGADGITLHLREDRRHIRDEDVLAIREHVPIPLNLEMACTPWMRDFALRARPHACCLVPERREELTTEGGLDAVAAAPLLAPLVATLRSAGIRVSLFIDPDEAQVAIAGKLGATAVELHTGSYCAAAGDTAQVEFARLVMAANAAAKAGLECHAGHGLDFRTAAEVAAIPSIAELNIGHFLVGEALVHGLSRTVARMKGIIVAAAAARPGMARNST